MRNIFGKCCQMNCIEEKEELTLTKNATVKLIDIKVLNQNQEYIKPENIKIQLSIEFKIYNGMQEKNDILYIHPSDPCNKQQTPMILYNINEDNVISLQKYCCSQLIEEIMELKQGFYEILYLTNVKLSNQKQDMWFVSGISDGFSLEIDDNMSDQISQNTFKFHSSYKKIQQENFMTFGQDDPQYPKLNLNMDYFLKPDFQSQTPKSLSAFKLQLYDDQNKENINAQFSQQVQKHIQKQQNISNTQKVLK